MSTLRNIFDNAGEDCQETDYLFCGLRDGLTCNTLHPSDNQKEITASDHIAAAYQQIWADDAEQTNRRMKRAEEARYAETENLHRENEGYKQELAYIHQTYELDSLEDKLRSAQKTEQWAESIL